MKRRTLKSPRARLVALAAGAGVLASLAIAAPAMADTPQAGVACKASDGKIFGRGSTFQINAVNKGFADGYEQDVCGSVGNAGNLNASYVQYSPFTGTATGRGNADPALDTALGDTTTANNMVAYDSIQQGKGSGTAQDPNFTGSGQGIFAVGCRDSAFGGTDVPYTTSQLATEDGTPASIGTAFTPCSQSKNGAGTEVLINPPYPPDSGTYPAAADAQASMMTLPIAGGALALTVHFGTGTSGCPATLQMSGLTLSKVMEGSTGAGGISTWNGLSGVDGNPTFNCLNTTTSAPLAITRVVRSDTSGSTQTIKNYLKNVDGSRTLATCPTASQTWTTLDNNANNWPSGTNCTTVIPASGTGGVVSTVQSTAGAIGYGDLSAWTSPPNEFVSLQNATHTAFITPGTVGGKSNCSLAVKGLPGSSTDSAVGLDGAPTPTTANATWATDAAANVSDITNQGAGFPLCALTWDMVYPETTTSLFGTGVQTIAGLTADQVRTIYSYFTYIYSPAAQARMNSLGYDALPIAWVDTLRGGFQSDF